MDSAPRRSYSALPWEKRRERPLACVALPRREPVRRVVHLERAPADGRTVAARGGQLLRRVAHGRARAPSPGLAVRYGARVRPGGRAACLAGARRARDHAPLVARPRALRRRCAPRRGSRRAGAPRRARPAPCGGHPDPGRRAAPTRDRLAPRARTVPDPASRGRARARRRLRARRRPGLEARRLPPPQPSRRLPDAPPDSPRRLEPRQQERAGPAPHAPSRGARLGVRRRRLPLEPARHVPGSRGRSEARHRVDPRAGRGLRRRPRLRGRDRRLRGRAPGRARRPHAERPGIPARLRGRRYGGRGLRGLLRRLRLHRPRRPLARRRAPPSPRAPGAEGALRERARGVREGVTALPPAARCATLLRPARHARHARPGRGGAPLRGRLPPRRSCAARLRGTPGRAARLRSLPLRAEPARHPRRGALPRLGPRRLPRAERAAGEPRAPAGICAPSMSDTAPPAPGGEYTCPMHPEVVRSGPGACPLCGMALEPRAPTAEEEASPALADMSRRFWLSLALTLPLFLAAMADMVPGEPLRHALAGRALAWIELALATPVVLWGGWPLLQRGAVSIAAARLNMFTLIAIGIGTAYAYSVVAALAPQVFPPSFRGHGGEVALYFEAAAVITTLVLLGQVLELRARHRTGSAIRALLGQIVRMVGEAQRSRAPIQRLADVVSAYFVPAVLVVAAVTFVVWLGFGPPPRVAYALANAVAVLIVACPCALGLATPMSIMVGVGRGATAGVLVKKAEALEVLERVDTLVVDKTGTLTEGRPRLVSVEVVPGLDEREVLALAAGLEQASEHPLAAAIVAGARARGLVPPGATEFRALPGKGVTGTVGGRAVALGNRALLAELGIDAGALGTRAEALGAEGQTVMLLAVDGRAAGLVGVADPVKPSTPDALRALRDDGVRVVMLTGDSRTTAAAVARRLGIDEVHAEVLPQEKGEVVRRLQAAGRVVAMAGDGVNDAPALAAAHVGIAMGTGADVALEAAGVTLVRSDLQAIVRARRLSRATMRNIRENLFFAFVYNALGVPIAAGVLYPVWGLLLNPMIASAAMSLSSVSVIGNALRLRRLAL